MATQEVRKALRRRFQMLDPEVQGALRDFFNDPETPEKLREMFGVAALVVKTFSDDVLAEGIFVALAMVEKKTDRVMMAKAMQSIAARRQRKAKREPAV